MHVIAFTSLIPASQLNYPSSHTIFKTRTQRANIESWRDTTTSTNGMNERVSIYSLSLVIFGGNFGSFFVVSK